ncbi:aminopeptidase [Sporanaerobium hydrogeniformans]|uniref:Aminopeptidase n=1 Tax=Sporanaerobium hydrogeniformans TaxID=3072179 RepID=A0AC61DGI6_9FIRM|nr:aminopeptidase [Sporanaerobium hydrogeniformans]PHV71990.1 aminopeptidase [Sporanaerobium hydrogeniformans]
MFEEKLKQYARLVVEVGVNIQKDQYLMIRTPLEGVYFARELAKCAYEVGAKRVYTEYSDEQMSKITYTYASEDALSEYPSWLAQGLTELAEKNAAFISISAGDPDLLKGVATSKIATAQKAAGEALATFRKYMSHSHVPWCVVSIPTPTWSQKLFPNVSKEESEKLLWDKIFEATRIDEKDPVRAWKDHVDNLERKCTFLNEKRLKKLHYTGPGTDLWVELPQDHLWEGGGETSTKGIYFVANMPTEEIFTLPSKYGVNGKLSSTKPFSYGGNLIDDFVLLFEKGKVVDCMAKEGEELLKKLLQTDEGASYLGEVALVPHSSPVSETGMIFFNTLFDENASCHFAFGNSYPTTLKGGTTMTDEELEKHGANISMIHEDFMVGGPKLSVEGFTVDNESIFLIKDGEWAF